LKELWWRTEFITIQRARLNSYELLKEILHRGDQLIAAYTRIIELQRENKELKESIAEQNELEREMLLALEGKK